MKYRLALILSLSIATSTWAENQGGLSADARRFFGLFNADNSDLKLSGLYQPENDEKDGPGSFDLLSYGAQLEFPVTLDDVSFIRLGGEYGARRYDFKEVADISTSLSSETLHKFSLTGGMGLFLSRDLLLTWAVRPGVYTDLENGVKTDEIQVYGDGLLVWQLNPGAQLVVGAAKNENFDSTPIYPIIGTRLMTEDGSLRIHLTFPTEARVGYNFDEDTQVYGGYWLSGDQYALKAGPLEKEFDVHLQDRRIGVGLQHWFTKHFNIKGEAGVSYESELEFKTRAAGQFSGELDPAGYASVGMGFAF